MYTLTKGHVGDYQLVTLMNTDTLEYVSVIPGLGGRVYYLCLLTRGKLMNILEKEERVEDMINERWYKGVILFPFPNRINAGTYDWEGKNYQLPINMPGEGHAIHGIMYNKVFSLVEDATIPSGQFSCKYDYDGDEDGYPFPCSVTYTFSLSENGFSCKVSVINKGEEVLPFGVGWHPYFTLGADVDTLTLRLPKVASIEVNEKMIPTGTKDSMNDYSMPTEIFDTEFDTGFLVEQSSEIETVSIENKERNVMLTFWQEVGERKFSYVQVFTPPGRKSIAIEPMTCPADAFNSKESLISLTKNEEWSGSFGVNLL